MSFDYFFGEWSSLSLHCGVTVGNARKTSFGKFRYLFSELIR